MQAVKSRDNAAERALRKTLTKLRLRYRLQVSWLPGRPDIVFPKASLVVFVDGDFWHGRILLEKGWQAFRMSLRTSRRAWWERKLVSNVERDLLTTAALEGLDYRVIRLWEKDVLRHPDRIAKRIARIVTTRSDSRHR
jgi:DNA mismatch endonuclease (patch repair protein)